MKLRNRIISVILILVLIPLSVVPVSAASPDDSGIINLLETSQFNVNGSPIYSTTFSTGYGISTDVTWEVPVSAEVSNFVLTIYSWRAIDSITFNGAVGELVGSNGNIKQYRFTTSGVWGISGFSSCVLDIRFPTTSSANISLISFLGFSSNSFSINSVDYSVYRDYLLHDHIISERDQLTDVNGASVPFQYFHSAGYGVGVSDRTLVSGKLVVKILPYQLGFDFLDKLTLQLFSSGEYYVAASLHDLVTDEQLSSLDIIEDDYNYAEEMYYNNSYQIAFQRNTISIDLAGYDLGNSYINVTLVTFDVTTDASTEEQSGFLFGVDWVEAFIPSDNVPWYMTFSRWLSSQFTYVSTWINNQTSSIGNFFTSNFSNLSSWITSQTDSLVSWLTNVRDSVVTWGANLYNVIQTWGQNLVAAINPDPDAGEDAKDQGTEKGQVIDNLNEQMNSMVKPDLSDSGDISDIISPGDLSNYSSFLTSILNAPYISQVVMLSLILSLAAYVLFGKR